MSSSALRRAVLLVALSGALVPPVAGETPADTLDQVASAFRDSSAQQLRATLPTGKKVYLDLPPVQEQEGFLASDQVYYLFREFFSRHETTSFRILRHDREPSGDAAFAHAEWRHRTPGGETRSEQLIFTLEKDGERWVVTEIRTARS